MGDGLDAMRTARKNASESRRSFTPPPPQTRRSNAAAVPAAPAAPSLAVVAPAAVDSEPAAARSATRTAAKAAASPTGASAQYLALKQMSDAALSWAAMTRKAAEREDALARQISAAVSAGVPHAEIRTAIAAAETKAADRLDPAALNKLLGEK